MAQKSPTAVPPGDNPPLSGQAGSNPSPAEQDHAPDAEDDDYGQLDADVSTAALDSEELLNQVPSWLSDSPHRLINISSLIWDNELIHGQIRRIRQERLLKRYRDVQKNTPTMPVSIVVKDMGGM